jgi:hypothetical protein
MRAFVKLLRVLCLGDHAFHPLQVIGCETDNTLLRPGV